MNFHVSSIRNFSERLKRKTSYRVSWLCARHCSGHRQPRRLVNMAEDLLCACRDRNRWERGFHGDSSLVMDNRDPKTAHLREGLTPPRVLQCDDFSAGSWRMKRSFLGWREGKVAGCLRQGDSICRGKENSRAGRI